jgi:hypothetical protein
MRSADQLIDTVQTTGIMVVAAALIYVVTRLECQIRLWAETLASIDTQLREQATAIRELGPLVEHSCRGASKRMRCASKRSRSAFRSSRLADAPIY